MADIVDKNIRSQMMSGIRSKDTGPELLIRKALFARGFRYRLHVKSLPGKPDIAFPKKKAVILIHGCFWHGHDCHFFKTPSSNVPFWVAKIERNKVVDNRTVESLKTNGWRILTIWECSLRGKRKLPLKYIIDETASWLLNGSSSLEIKGTK
jgi:DNA mismatch endonuclease (patch repair protein)